MGAALRQGIPGSDEITITALSGKLAIKNNIQQDITEGSINNSVAETIIAQVSFNADVVANHIIIMASIRFHGGGSSPYDTGTFKIRIGQAGTTADNQIGDDFLMQNASTVGGSLIAIAIDGTHFDKTKKNYVSITGQNSRVDVTTACFCNALSTVGV